MMDLELKLERPLRRHAVWSALVMGAAYSMGKFNLTIKSLAANIMQGGLLPMIPYFAMHDVRTALFISMGLAIFVLITFGFLKAWLFGATTRQSLQSAASTLLIGAIAAGASYGIVRGIDATF